MHMLLKYTKYEKYCNSDFLFQNYPIGIYPNLLTVFLNYRYYTPAKRSLRGKCRSHLVVGRLIGPLEFSCLLHNSKIVQSIDFEIKLLIDCDWEKC